MSKPVAIAGPHLRVSLCDPAYADAVVADVLRMRRTPSGVALLRRLHDGGCIITIEKPFPPTEPPNAWTHAVGSGSNGAALSVAYNPADWPCPARPGSCPSDVVLFGRLEAAAPQAATGRDNSPAIEAYLQERTAIPGRPRP